MAVNLPNRAVDAVVFDVGGVLLDWDPHHLYRRLIPDEGDRTHFLTEVCTPDWNAAQDAGRSWAEAVADLSDRYPAYTELILAYDQRWEDMVAGPIHGTVELLEELKRAAVPVYALTNFSSDKWAVAIERWPFLADLDGWVVSGEEGVTKPDARIYRTLLDRFGLEGAATFYVDDQPANVREARRQGLVAEVFVDAPTLRRQLDDLGVLIQSS